MAKARTERLLNLLFVLLNSKHPITREQLRIRVPGYEGSSDEAFERMFERDKEALRELNIPVLTQPVDLFHDDVVGYRIDRDTWLMPEIKFSKDERVLLSLAASAWNGALLSEAAIRGVARLAPDELELLPTVTHRLGYGREGLAQLLSAISNKVSVTFEYQAASSSEITQRAIDPWKVILHGGQWYLIGFDLNRGETRSFRLDRMVNLPVVTEQSIIEPAPSDLDAQAVVSKWQSRDAEDAELVTLEVLPGSAIELRLLASDIEILEESDRLRIPFLDEAKLVEAIARNCHLVSKVEPERISIKVAQVLADTLRVHLDG